RAELVQLAQAVHPVAGRRPRRDDEPRLLQVTEHAGGPAGLGRRVTDMEGVHPRDLNTSVSSLASEPRDEPVERCLVGARRKQAVPDALLPLDLLEHLGERAAGGLRDAAAPLALLLVGSPREPFVVERRPALVAQ